MHVSGKSPIIGLLTQEEDYWSLATVTAATRRLAARYLQGPQYHWDRRASYDAALSRAVFRSSDVVFSLASRAPREHRGRITPGILHAHAWMDHAAGLSLHLFARFFHSSDVLVFASTAARSKYLLAYPAGLPSVVIPYFVPGLANALPLPRRSGRLALAARYGLEPTQRWVLYFGRFSQEKNVGGLVHAWERRARRDATLVLVGAEDSTRTFGFGGQPQHGDTSAGLVGSSCRGVRWLAPLCRPSLLSLVAAADVAVNPTLCLEEDFGLSAAEAMSVGVPVVCSDWGGLRDIVVHGETGFRARTFLQRGRARLDEEELIAYIDRLLDDEPLRQRMAEASRARAASEYSEAAFFRRVTELAATVAHRAGQRADATMTPAAWIRPAYERAIARGTADRIYAAPALFETLYGKYATPTASGS